MLSKLSLGIINNLIITINKLSKYISIINFGNKDHSSTCLAFHTVSKVIDVIFPHPIENIYCLVYQNFTIQDKYAEIHKSRQRLCVHYDEPTGDNFSDFDRKYCRVFVWKLKQSLPIIKLKTTQSKDDFKRYKQLNWKSQTFGSYNLNCELRFNDIIVKRDTKVAKKELKKNDDDDGLSGKVINSIFVCIASYLACVLKKLQILSEFVKQSKIIHLFDSNSYPTNFSPISILPTPRKTLEKNLITQLFTHFYIKKTITNIIVRHKIWSFQGYKKNIRKNKFRS